MYGNVECLKELLSAENWLLANKNIEDDVSIVCVMLLSCYDCDVVIGWVEVMLHLL